MRALLIFLGGLVIFVAYAAKSLHPKTTTIVPAAPVSQPATNTVLTTETAPPQVMSPGPIIRRAVEVTKPEVKAPGIGAEGLTVQEAAARIAGTRGRPSIVLLYGTQCPLTRRMFSDFVALARRHPEVDILAFATDEELAGEVPDFLQSHGASFAPVYIREWQPGAFTQAMAPLGINAGAEWVRPLVAVRDASGRVIAQAQGVTDVTGVEQTLSRLR